jgi:hypothetical protein
MAVEFNSMKQLIIAIVIIGVVVAAGVMTFFKKYAPEIVENPPVAEVTKNTEQKQPKQSVKSPPLPPGQIAALREEGERLIREGRNWAEEGKRAISRAEMYEKGKQKSKTASIQKQDTFAAKLRQKGMEYIKKGEELISKGESLLHEASESEEKK